MVVIGKTYQFKQYAFGKRVFQGYPKLKLVRNDGIYLSFETPSGVPLPRFDMVGEIKICKDGFENLKSMGCKTTYKIVKC